MPIFVDQSMNKDIRVGFAVCAVVVVVVAAHLIIMPNGVMFGDHTAKNDKIANGL